MPDLDSVWIIAIESPYILCRTTELLTTIATDVIAICGLHLVTFPDDVIRQAAINAEGCVFRPGVSCNSASTRQRISLVRHFIVRIIHVVCLVAYIHLVVVKAKQGYQFGIVIDSIGT